MAKRNKRQFLVGGEWIWKLDRAHWTMLLQPYADFFAKHGMALDADRAYDFWVIGIHDVILKHEAELPEPLKDAFWEIVPLCDERAHEEFIRLAAKNNLTLTKAPSKLTGAELAVEFYLNHRGLFSNVYALEMTSQPTVYREFYDLTRTPVEGHFANKEARRRFDGKNGQHWKSRERTDFSETLITENEDEIVILVTHGDLMKSMGIIRPESRKREQIRVIPDKHDTIRIEKASGKISIHTQHLKDVEQYAHMIGDCFFDNPNHYSAKASYTGAPLLYDWMRATSTEGFPEIEWVRPTDLLLSNGKPRRPERFAHKLSGDELVLKLPHLAAISATLQAQHVEFLKLVFKTKGSGKKTTTVELKMPNTISIRGPAQELVFRFLKARGFSIAPTPIRLAA